MTDEVEIKVGDVVNLKSGSQLTSLKIVRVAK